MDTVTQAEAELVKHLSWNAGSAASALDALLGPLLSLVSGYGSRASDGVLIEHEERSGSRYYAAGVAVLITGQLVEPVAFDLTLNPSGTALAEGTVKFGLTRGSGVRFGSPEHKNLHNEVIANPRGRLEWRCVFTRTLAGWSASYTAA